MTDEQPKDIYLQLGASPDKGRTMLTSRRNRGCGQWIFVALVLLTLLYGVYLYLDLKKNFEETRDRAIRYQQQQESLTGQLQVVYEHRLRLEKALQESKTDAKRTKEESQRKLEIHQQESNNRFNALNIEHKMLKSKHDDLKEELEQAQTEQRKAEEEKDQIEDHLKKNISSILGSASAKQQSLLAQIEYLTGENEKGQQCSSDLQQTMRQLDKVIQEKALQATRIMELDQLLSSCESGKSFLQTSVENLSNQVKSLEMQLQQFNIQKNAAPNIQVNGPRPVANGNLLGNRLPQNNIVPGAPMDPYEQQKLAFDRQRQQDLVEQQYAKQNNMNIPLVGNPQNGQAQVIINPGIQQQQPAVQQKQQLPQQQQLQQQQQQMLKQQQNQQQPQQPVQQQPNALNPNPQQLVPEKETNEIRANLQLHLAEQDKENNAEEKKESDYGEGEESESDGQAQGVMLKDPAKAAREKPVVQEDNPVDKEGEERLPDAVHDRQSREREGVDAADGNAAGIDDDDEPRWHGGNSEEKNQDELMQANQEQQIEDGRRREEAELDEMALHPPGDSQGGVDDNDRGFHLEVQRDEVEEHIEKEEGIRRKQQQQLQARAQEAREDARDEDSDYDNKNDGSESNNDPAVVPMQRKFRVPIRGGDGADDDPGDGVDQQENEDRALDRPEINDAPMNEAVNDAPVLDHPREGIEEDEEKQKQHREFNQEMR